MSLSLDTPARAPSPAETPWGVGVEIDQHTALALGQAAVVALQNMSDETRDAVNRALEREVALMEIQADPVSQVAAQSLLQVIREAVFPSP